MAHRLQSVRALWRGTWDDFLCSRRGLSHLSRDWAHARRIARWPPNLRAARKVPVVLLSVCVSVMGTPCCKLYHLTCGCSCQKFAVQSSPVAQWRPTLQPRGPPVPGPRPSAPRSPCGQQLHRRRGGGRWLPSFLSTGLSAASAVSVFRWALVLDLHLCRLFREWCLAKGNSPFVPACLFPRSPCHRLLLRSSSQLTARPAKQHEPSTPAVCEL